MNTGSVPQSPAFTRGLSHHQDDPRESQRTDFPLVTTGDSPTSVVALRPNTERSSSDDAILWSSNMAAPRRTTPLLTPAGVFTVDDDGVAALTANSRGDVLDRVRLSDAYWSSPVRAGETIFTFGKEGTAATLTTTDVGDLKVADERTLDEGVWATPALAGGGLVLRTEHTLRFYHPDGAPK